MTKVIYGCQVEVGDLQSGGLSKCTLMGMLMIDWRLVVMLASLCLLVSYCEIL